MECVTVLTHDRLSNKVRIKALQRRQEQMQQQHDASVGEALEAISGVLLEQEQTIISQGKQIDALIDRVVELNQLLGR
jgi:uncharacterized coiled-coil protein SlyX